jgi:O-succinylbenzoic acid--CoA ligase
VPVALTYGLTEACSQVTTLPMREVAARPASAGKPLFMTQVAILGDKGETCGPQEAGEIAVRGPTVTAGYLGRETETQRLLADGWLHTGDWGYLDGEGYLYVLDRRDDIIISGGENVYPAEVEAVLESHPSVAEAGVYGVADREWGAAVAAAVCLVPNQVVSEPDLREFCRQHLAAFKVPRRIRFEKELPRNAAGKLLRRELREGEQ